MQKRISIYVRGILSDEMLRAVREVSEDIQPLNDDVLASLKERPSVDDKFLELHEPYTEDTSEVKKCGCRWPCHCARIMTRIR